MVTMAQFKEPAFNIKEPAPFYLCAALIIIHALMSVFPAGIVQHIDSASVLAASQGNFMFDDRPLGNIATLFLHGLLHADWSHVIMNSFMIFIFGTLVSRVAGRKKTAIFFLIFALSVIAGGLFQWGWWAIINDNASAIGASGGASGLFAAGAWVLGGKKQLYQWGIVFGLINVIMVISTMMSSGFGGGGIAWAAHIGGYVGGALLAAILLPPRSATFGMIR